MKKSRDELLQGVDTLGLTDDEKIALMEDIADSIVDETENLARIEQLENEIADLKAKYKARFLNVEEKEEVTEEKTEEEKDEEEREEEIVDVKEI